MKINTKPFEDLLNTMRTPGGAYYSSDIIDVLSEAIKLAEAVNSMIWVEKEIEPLWCPFCGENKDIKIPDYFDGKWFGFVQCQSCLAEGSRGKTVKEAIQKWNTRA